MSTSVTIKFPTESEVETMKECFFSQMREQRARQTALVAEARKALPILVKACAYKTGQGYKLRALLFSLWNGKPANLSDVVCLDRELRDALGHVIAAFGCDGFFYDQIFQGFEEYNLWGWFLETGANNEETKNERN